MATYRLCSHDEAIKSIETSLHTILDDYQDTDLRNVRVLNVQAANRVPSIDTVSMLQSKNVHDILSVHGDLDRLSNQPHRNTLGNDAVPRVWHGELASLPAYMGPFQMILVDIDAMEEGTLRDTLTRCSLITRPGGSVLVWSNNGIQFEKTLLEDAMHGLCFELVDFGTHVAKLRVPDHFALQGGIRYMQGKIVTGYGRGSKKLGVPTANILPADVEGEIAGLPSGVYFGWAKLITSDTQLEADGLVHKMVMNIGKRPTFVKDNSPDVSVEVHIMHSFPEDFYGKRIKVLVLGYLRPEMKFENISVLLNRIQTDIGLSKSQLDGDVWSKYAADPFFD